MDPKQLALIQKMANEVHAPSLPHVPHVEMPHMPVPTSIPKPLFDHNDALLAAGAIGTMGLGGGLLMGGKKEKEKDKDAEKKAFDLEKHISPDLRESVQRFGFDKVAAKMFGVEEINEKTASVLIGTSLMTRLAEWNQVSVGLAALKDLGG